MTLWRSGISAVMILSMLHMGMGPALAATSNCTIDDDGKQICPPTSGPVPSTNAEQVNQNANAIPGIMPASCPKAFPDQIPVGSANLPGNMKYLNEARCQAYLHLESLYSPGGCSRQFDLKDGITSLNYQFAQNLSNMLKAAPYKITITSGYRNPDAQRCANPNGFGGDANGSLHTRGFAADLQYPDALGTSAKGCDSGNTSPSYQWVKANASKYGVNLYNQNGHTTYVKGECNHVEISNPNAVPGGLGPSGASTVMAGTGGGGSRGGTGNFGVVSDCPTNYTVVNGVKTCGNSSNSIFGSGSMSQMVQMMMGLQIGQALGNMFGNLFKGSTSNTGSSGPTYTSNPIPTTPGGTTSGGTTSGGTTAVEDLLKTLGNPSGTTGSTITPTTTAVIVPPTGTSTGQIVDTPTTTAQTPFVNPTSGVAPLTVKAHFMSGLPCASAYDLSWDDGSKDAMIYTPAEAPNSCAMINKSYDIEHTYATSGVYTVTLKQSDKGAPLAVSTTSVVTVLATSTGTTVSGPTVAEGGATTTPSTSSFGKLLSDLGKMLLGIPGAVIQFFASLFSDDSSTTGTATTTPTVTGQEIIIGTSTIAQPGDTVYILYDAYVGEVSTVTLFDTSEYYNNEPLSFQLGSSTVIEGLQIGVNGMYEGGERLLSIPPEFGFGGVALTDASGTVIVPASSTLIFDVRLVRVVASSTAQ